MKTGNRLTLVVLRTDDYIIGPKGHILELNNLISLEIKDYVKKSLRLSGGLWNDLLETKAVRKTFGNTAIPIPTVKWQKRNGSHVLV